VNPPLRTRADMMALRSAVKEGHIDCITSHHLPQNWDNKTCEFEYASDGMIGLQSCFSVINNLFPDIPTESLIDLFGNNARTIFNLSFNSIEIGSKADFTLFSRTETSTYTINNNKSHSLNSAFFDKEFKGAVKGVFSKGQWLANQLKA
jgi:dihydroorotase